MSRVGEAPVPPVVAAGLPPGPDPATLPNVLGELGRDPAALLQRLVDQYGTIVGIDVPGAPIVLVNDPELARSVLVELQHHTVKGAALVRSRPVLGEGLLTSEGDNHARARRLIAPAFHRPRLARYAGTIDACTREASATWGDATSLDVRAAAARLTLDIVGRTLFGVDLREQADGIATALDVAIDEFARRTTFGPFDVDSDDRELADAIERLDAVVAGMIADRRGATRPGDDLLSALVAARDVDSDGCGLSDQEVRDHTMTLLLAGHETTANALAWTLGLLATSPPAQKRLRAEVRAGHRAGLTPTEAAAQPFTRAVVSESLRLYPPAWAMARRTTTPVVLGGWSLPTGTTVVVSPWLLHHDAESYENPLRFDPDRWLDARAAARPREAFLPFGAGTRSCIGEQLASLELGICLTALIGDRHFEPCLRTSFAREYAVTLRPRDGMWLSTSVVSQ